MVSWSDPEILEEPGGLHACQCILDCANVARAVDDNIPLVSIGLIRRNRKRLKLRGFVYYSWRDATPYAPDYRDMWGLHTGLVQLNGRPKPALLEFTRAIRRLR